MGANEEKTSKWPQRTIDGLKAKISEIWDSITPTECLSLTKTMHLRLTVLHSIKVQLRWLYEVIVVALIFLILIVPFEINEHFLYVSKIMFFLF